ncbi:liver-expressed antimicrobial peptide 2 [Dromaius novaehollandiae]|uniref:Liver-expressed antimicrobial peptide 2 n=1 Tax=Dromaius novaehollandiae TaxID=8790 RepID=A0A5B8RPI4_DRONO|nr:liver-expressed antimicrobial peptide 2 [Dromaius novaehollandiae]QEA09216.1 liver-expressed antimicrobial peptide 2 [Dromaius novaehollandiae]
MLKAAAHIVTMHCWKAMAVFLLCSLLLSQTRCASLRQLQPRLTRQRRMTPFWRGVALRPVGASCRDNSECITMLCRKNRCFLRTAYE